MNVLLLDDDADSLHAGSEELRDAGFNVVAFATFAALPTARGTPRPDVALVELDLPGQSLSDAIRGIGSRWADVPIVALTAHVSDEHVFSALRAGAVGYVLKHDVRGCLAKVVTDAASGGAPITPSVARRVLAVFREPDPAGSRALESAPASVRRPKKTSFRGERPTAREAEVLEALARGLTYQECGTALGIGVDTIRAHVRSVYRKLHAASKAEAVAVALRQGWLG